mmetsp:Transcript_38603/g.70801  ORF Transcript_38603/g.70801 Transcript_38603/m.70801 type:complete len:111 (+) Transcript_38603:2201-2533(+)
MFPFQALISYSCYGFSDNILIILFLSVASTVINDDFVTIEVDISVLIFVLFNDIAALPLPNPLMVVSARPLKNGGTCTVGPNGGSVEFVSDDGFVGENECTYEACDSRFP